MFESLMFELPRHGGFILASYLVTFGLLAWMVLGTLMASRRARRRLRELEAAAGDAA